MVSNLQVELAIYNFDLFHSALMDKQGGVWLLPQDDATLLLLETIEDILEKAEEESQRTTLFEPPIESCWMVDVPPQILRVRVEDNLGRGGLIVVRSVDYGFAMSVKPEQLNSLPVDLENMQGLAVYGKLLTSDSGSELQGALCDVLVNDGKVVLTPQSSSNQQGGEAMIDEIQWDPMAEHQAKPGKQKKEDLGTEVDGYISKQSTCAFYMNRGKCWKKHFCQDLHMLPRHGAVTVDSELTFMGQDYSVNYSQAPNRRLDDQNMVEAEYSAALSPTMYYLKFPKGLKGLLEDKRYYKQWWSNLQHFYSKEGSRLSLTSLPATGFSYVARIPTKGWHRILVKEMLDVEDQIIALLVDEGRQEVVDLGSVYDLDPSFSQLPHQAVLCYLAGVEPVTTDFGAHSTVAPLLQDAFLLVKPPMSLENPLMVEIMLGDQWLSDVLVSKGLVTQVKPLD